MLDSVSLEQASSIGAALDYVVRNRHADMARVQQGEG